MAEVIAGLQVADDGACYEFVRRQPPETLGALAMGARRMGQAAFALALGEHDKLIAWKYPELPEAIAVDVLRPLLETAAAGAADGRLRSQLMALAFGQWMTLHSLGGRLSDYAARRPLVARRRPDPQLALWP